MRSPGPSRKRDGRMTPAPIDPHTTFAITLAIDILLKASVVLAIAGLPSWWMRRASAALLERRVDRGPRLAAPPATPLGDAPIVESVAVPRGDGSGGRGGVRCSIAAGVGCKCGRHGGRGHRTRAPRAGWTLEVFSGGRPRPRSAGGDVALPHRYDPGHLVLRRPGLARSPRARRPAYPEDNTRSQRGRGRAE